MAASVTFYILFLHTYLKILELCLYLSYINKTIKTLTIKHIIKYGKRKKKEVQQQ